MPAIARQGDTVLSVDGAGYQCGSPMNTTVGECNTDNVYCNGILVVVSGNKVTEHPKVGCIVKDNSTLTDTSSTVFIGGKGIGRIGDTYEGVNMISQGSTDVFSS